MKGIFLTIQLFTLDFEGFSFTDHSGEDCHSRDRRFAKSELLRTDEVEALGHPNGPPDAITKIAKNSLDHKLDQW